MKKRVSQETKNKIGRGVKTHYDKKGRKKKIGLAVGVAGLAGAGLGLMALKKRGLKPKLGTPQNPYVERAKIPGLPDKVSKSTNQARRGFTDTLGRVFKKGRFLPKGVSDIGLVKKGKRPIDATKQVGRSQEALSKISVDASNTQASDKWLTIDVESKRFSRLVPYTVNFNKEELIYTVPTYTQSLVKDSISRINFAKEEKVKSYTTKKGKRVRAFGRKVERKLAESGIKTKELDRKEKTGRTIGTLLAGGALLGGAAYIGRKSLMKNKPEILEAVDKMTLIPKKKRTLSTAEDLKDFLKNGRKTPIDITNDQIRSNLEKTLMGEKVIGPSTKSLGRKLARQKLKNDIGREAKRSLVYIGEGISKPSPFVGLTLLAAGTSAGGSLGAKIGKEKYFKDKGKKKK
jgi:hypothetical protein